MGSDYENDAPVTDPMTVLDLITPGWGDSSVRCILRWPHAPDHAEIAYVRDFGPITTLRYLVATECVDSMLSMGLLCGTPKWGYTCMRELRVSSRGEAYLWEERGRLGMNFPRAARWLRRERATGVDHGK